MDTFQEILASLRQNRFRTFMTGFAVAWGIFILIVLLAASSGLKNGIVSNFGDRKLNSMNIWAGKTSIPYKGLQSNRSIAFTPRESEIIRQMPEIDKFSTFANQQKINITYKGEYSALTFKGVEPDFKDVFGVKMSAGRFINAMDLHEKSKHIVLDERAVELLNNGNTNILGQYVKVGNVAYKVVGIAAKENSWEGATAYIPLTTHQGIYSPDKKYYDMMFTMNGLDTREANENFVNRVRGALASSLIFDPNDTRAIGTWNALEAYLETQGIANAITVFVLIIGIFTLISGAVGVSNIMLVSVRERTKEIGIRKALGASPRNIIASILGEALIITTTFGYIGMMLGVGLVELINNNLNIESSNSGNLFKDPTVELPYVFIATAILIIVGVLAGYIPARKAVKVRPIEAMRTE